jgi:hypothetical protein
MEKKILFLFLLFLPFTFLNAQEIDENFNPNGHFSGQIFGDYFYKISSDTIGNFKDADGIPVNPKWGNAEFAQIDQDFNAFSIRMAQFGYEYNFSPNISSTFLLEGDVNAISQNNNANIFIKLAFAQIKNILPNMNFLFGLIPTPTFDNAEGIWAYRPVEKTIFDYRGLGRPVDLGVSIKGTLSNDNFGYQLMVGNGAAMNSETDKYKNVYLNLYTWLFNKKLFIETYGEYSNVNDGLVTKNNISSKVILAFKSDKFTLGTETGIQILEKSKLNGGNYRTRQIFVSSVYSNITLIDEKLFAFARFDIYKLDLDYNTSDFYGVDFNPYDESFLSIGLDYEVIENLHFIPNFWMNGYTDLRSINNYDRKPDMVTRISFLYKF